MTHELTTNGDMKIETEINEGKNACGSCGAPMLCGESANFCDECKRDDLDDLLDLCPNCGKWYDEIDREYQICHYCKYDSNKTPTP